MKKIWNGIKKAIFSRIMIIAILVLFQMFLLFISFDWLSGKLHYVTECLSIVGALLAVRIINRDESPEFKVSWLIPICVFPIFGALLYLFVELNFPTMGLRKRVNQKEKESSKYLRTEEETKQALAHSNHDVKTLSYYLDHVGGYPTYRGTETTYFPLGEDNWKDILVELEKAEKFIFLEYFIISEGTMWNSVLDILKRKVNEGVEVRVMYDGTCAIYFLPRKYDEKLRQFGIKIKIFSPIIPMLSTHQNNRDHRKILVIDGKVAYTGGVNLADEYINKKMLYGHWKDVAIKMRGDAVKSFTAMFLQLWSVDEEKEIDYTPYLNNANFVTSNSEGFIIPYGDGPNKKDNLAETVYLDILNRAHNYVHIMTPYFIVDNSMITAFKYAAKRGIDVKLIVPHIPDKKITYDVARTFYPILLRAGVKVYEYTPGFIHAKVVTSDEVKAVVGSINFDYRSLYHHFECASYIYKSPAIRSIEMDFNDTLKMCQEVTMEYYKKIPIHSRMIGCVCKFFAPLL